MPEKSHALKKGCDREIKHVPVLVSCADTSKEKEGKNQSSTTHRQEAISGSRFDFFCRFSPFAPTTVCLSLFRPSFLRHRRGRGKREEEAGKAAAAAPSQDSSSSFSSPPPFLLFQAPSLFPPSPSPFPSFFLGRKEAVAAARSRRERGSASHVTEQATNGRGRAELKIPPFVSARAEERGERGEGDGEREGGREGRSVAERRKKRRGPKRNTLLRTRLCALLGSFLARMLVSVLNGTSLFGGGGTGDCLLRNVNCMRLQYSLLGR